MTCATDIGNITQNEQNGFRSGRNCLDHIYSLTSIVPNRMRTNLPTYCAFVDFQKAFDWVNRDMLLYKMRKYIESLLVGSSSQISTNKVTSLLSGASLVTAS